MIEINSSGFQISPEQDRLQTLLGELILAKANKDKRRVKQLKKEIKEVTRSPGNIADARGQQTVRVPLPKVGR